MAGCLAALHPVLDVLRERGNTYLEQSAKEVPHVLGFKAELVHDGRTLERPVNYALVRIVPPAGTKIDPTKAPIIVVDPRAGHGPGIGGMKQDSEIGVALAAGHACYFIGFLPKPMPEQTIEDVCRAEAIFIEDVAARHPDAEGKPMIIANCQAGWQIMMMAATRLRDPGRQRGPLPTHRRAHFEDLDALQAGFGSEEGQAAVNDIPNFATGGVTVFFAELD